MKWQVFEHHNNCDVSDNNLNTIKTEIITHFDSGRMSSSRLQSVLARPLRTLVQTRCSSSRAVAPIVTSDSYRKVTLYSNCLIWLVVRLQYINLLF